jgi:hypothetical protein
MYEVYCVAGTGEWVRYDTGKAIFTAPDDAVPPVNDALIGFHQWTRDGAGASVING